MRTNLVPRRTRLIGRDGELAVLRDAFASGARLVTLTGPGGVGKTRLAHELALSGGSWDEAWFCDLSSATDLDGVCAAVADALEVALGAGPPEVQLAQAIGGRARTLLVLDNFEQVTASAAGAVATWMRARDGARLLVTSRETLQLADELVVAVEPLAANTDAAHLLADRLGPSAAEASVEPELLPTIAAALDGIPLALELAAPRIAMLGSREVLCRLGQGLEVLAGGPRDAAARQRTMGRAVEWSWDLLGADEQGALVTTCLFRGGFSIAAAEAVLQGPGSVLAVIESLRNKSLLRRAAGDREGALRLEPYGVVRAHLAERVAALPAEARRRHAAYFAAWGERIASQLDGAEAAGRLRELALERDNLLAAVDWATGPGGDGALALRAALVLARLTWIRGPLALQVRTLDRVVDADGRGGEQVLQARARIARGNALRRTGSLERGRADIEEALALAQRSGHEVLEAEARTDRAALGIQESKLEEAQADANRAIALLAARDEPARLAAAQAIAANVLHHSGQIEAAVASFEQAIALYRKAGHRRGESVMLTALAGLRLELGRHEEAIELASRASALQQELGDRWQAYSRSTLAQAWLDAGDLAAARAEYDAARRVALDAGDPYQANVCLGFRGVADCLAGDGVVGAGVLGEAIAALDWGMARSVLCGFWGAALASLGRIEQAREVLDAAEQALAQGGGLLLLEAVRIHRGVLELALAARATDPEAAKTLRQRAAARAGAATVSAGDEPPLTRRSVEVRLALAVLERALGAGGAPAGPAVVVHASGAWLTTRAGARVDFGKRPLHRRLLVALAERRLTAPGTPLTAEELLAIAWPGERILPEAARNRLYVAMSRLRTLGLEDVLVSGGAGYLLDPAVPLRLVRDP